MTTRRYFFPLVLLSLVGRAVSFSASSPPPPPLGSSDPGNEGTRKLKAPPRDIVVPFTGQIKRARSARDAIEIIVRIERISKCAKEKLVDKALGLLKRMINQGVAPDVWLFSVQ